MYPAEQSGEPPPAVGPLEEGSYHEAADRALRRYPGPVGELLFRELSAYADFGHRFATDADALMPLLTTHLLASSAAPSLPAGPVPELRPRPTPGPTLWPRPARRGGR